MRKHDLYYICYIVVVYDMVDHHHDLLVVAFLHNTETKPLIKLVKIFPLIAAAALFDSRAFQH